MKNRRTLQLILVIALVALFSVGCARKPAPEVSAPVESGPAKTTQVPVETIKAYAPQDVAPMVDPFDEASSKLKRVFFEYDQHTLSDQARATLAENAAFLKANPSIKISIEGHCDERGSDEYNVALGERRAQAVKSYLGTLGVADGRMSTVSYGEEKPLDAGHAESSWSKNRRAEFKAVR